MLQLESFLQPILILGRRALIRFTCDQCGKDIPDIGSEYLDRVKSVGINGIGRITAVSGQLSEGYPLKGHKPASDEELSTLEAIGRELADLLFHKKIFCSRCTPLKTD